MNSNTSWNTNWNTSWSSSYKLVVLLLLVLVASCGLEDPPAVVDVVQQSGNIGEPPADYPAGIDPVLQSYYDKFERLRLQYSDPVVRSTYVPIYVPAKFVAVADADNPLAVAVCISGIGWQYIRVELDYWRTATRWEREALVLHELGHCILGRDHLELLDPKTGMPISLMYPEVVGSWPEYPQIRELLYYELFNPAG